MGLVRLLAVKGSTSAALEIYIDRNLHEGRSQRQEEHACGNKEQAAPWEGSRSQASIHTPCRKANVLESNEVFSGG